MLLMTCERCHGENVVRDAWAEWNSEKECWELSNVFDFSFCRDCEGSTNIQGVVIREPKPETEPETGN